MMLLTGDDTVEVAIVNHQTGDTTCLCSVPFVMLPPAAGAGAYPFGDPGGPAAVSAWPFVTLGGASPRLSLLFFFFPSSPAFGPREALFLEDEPSPFVSVSVPLPLRSDGAAVVGAGAPPGGGGYATAPGGYCPYGG